LGFRHPNKELYFCRPKVRYFLKRPRTCVWCLCTGMAALNGWSLTQWLQCEAEAGFFFVFARWRWPSVSTCVSSGDPVDEFSLTVCAYYVAGGRHAFSVLVFPNLAQRTWCMREIMRSKTLAPLTLLLKTIIGTVIVVEYLRFFSIRLKNTNLLQWEIQQHYE